MAASHGHCLDENCESFEETVFNLTVVSQTPRVLVLENFLTDLERNKLIELAVPNLAQSTMGNGKGLNTGNTRTSKTAWLNQWDQNIVKHIGLRIMETMKVPLSMINESEVLQVVQYKTGQTYGNHWDCDWEVEDMDMKENRPEEYLKHPRYATFGIYAQTPEVIRFMFNLYPSRANDLVS